MLKARFTVPLAFSVALVSATGLSAQTKAPTPAGKPAAGRTTYNVAPTGNEARYKVEEELASIGYKQVVGKTTDVKGKIVLDAGGAVVKDSSKIVINAQALTTDNKQRDKKLKTQALETDKYAQIILVPTSFNGFTGDIAAGEEKTFTLLGDLTVRNITTPTTWQVVAKKQGNDIVGTARAAYALADLKVEKPKAVIVFSIADSVHLEYDFHFTPASTTEVVK